ncbi:uncharacterized protein I303_108458 [Kwoniella dejecticola CBS 10117]|uniref:AGC protein kinase n=1 Tax=Kwoniella dejecticola CBS 10117 TaxID=1296121 RepID=A0A1A5ZXD5_9TREE|nr:AGC protein kinase [Kwoniella dejecticola CBS 10117]OBR82458.1 AGC protein kinase [Kwoniella dejecticola CBS 10117]
MSSPTSYPHRHQLLTELLRLHPCPFEYENTYHFLLVPSLSQLSRSAALDAILLQSWSGNIDHVDPDVIHNIKSLRFDASDFEVIGRLGDGQFGVVDAVRCRINGQIYASKTMKKRAVSRAGPQLSLSIERHMHIIGHSSQGPVPRLIAAFQSDQTISLITTYAECGSLWDRLCCLSTDGTVAGQMTETELSHWSPQMILAIQWVHDQGFAHRDIKPHNFLIASDRRLLLTDFGSAASLLPKVSTGQRQYVPYDQCLLPAGTPDYIAPEILAYAENAFSDHISIDHVSHGVSPHGYDSSVDWWSLGASLFEMATGKGPFWAPTIQQTYNLITQFRGELQLPPFLGPEISDVLTKYVRGHLGDTDM